MDEGVVRMQAEMYALVAEMLAIHTNVEAMRTENSQRESLGQAQAWPAECFFDAQKDLETLATRFRDEI